MKKEVEKIAAAGLAASSVMTAAGIIAGSNTVTTIGIAGMIAAGGSMAALPVFKKEDAEKIRRLFGKNAEEAVVAAATKLGEVVKQKLQPKELESLKGKQEEEIASELASKDPNLGKLAETIVKMKEALKALDELQIQEEKAPKAAKGATT